MFCCAYKLQLKRTVPLAYNYHMVCSLIPALDTFKVAPFKGFQHLQKCTTFTALDKVSSMQVT